MADLKRIEDLIFQRLVGQLSAEEIKELQAWAEESTENKEFLERMTAKYFKQKFLDLRKINWERLDRKVMEKLRNHPLCSHLDTLFWKDWGRGSVLADLLRRNQH